MNGLLSQWKGPGVLPPLSLDRADRHVPVGLVEKVGELRPPGKDRLGVAHLFGEEAVDVLVEQRAALVLRTWNPGGSTPSGTKRPTRRPPKNEVDLHVRRWVVFADVSAQHFGAGQVSSRFRIRLERGYKPWIDLHGSNNLEAGIVEGNIQSARSRK